MLDASGFRIGIFDLEKSESYSRQMGWAESAATDICGYEARAVEMCILNIDLNKRPSKIRLFFFSIYSILTPNFSIHCDNMGVVSSFADYKGCRHPVVK